MTVSHISMFSGQGLGIFGDTAEIFYEILRKSVVLANVVVVSLPPKSERARRPKDKFRVQNTGLLLGPGELATQFLAR